MILSKWELMGRLIFSIVLNTNNWQKYLMQNKVSKIADQHNYNDIRTICIR